jgi:hypothetical protein
MLNKAIDPTYISSIRCTETPVSIQNTLHGSPSSTSFNPKFKLHFLTISYLQFVVLIVMGAAFFCFFFFVSSPHEDDTPVPVFLSDGGIGDVDSDGSIMVLTELRADMVEMWCSLKVAPLDGPRVANNIKMLPISVFNLTRQIINPVNPSWTANIKTHHHTNQAVPPSPACFNYRLKSYFDYATFLPFSIFLTCAQHAQEAI